MLILKFFLILSSMLMLLMKHPLSMGLSLLVQAILVAMISGYMNITFWYSYMLFLIMIGGMLVLFMYMTTVASNEKFLFPKNIMSFMIMFFIMLSYIIFYEKFMNMNISESSILNMKILIPLNKFINTPLNSILIMLIIYLLITLIVVIKVVDVKHGPLRKIN